MLASVIYSGNVSGLEYVISDNSCLGFLVCYTNWQNCIKEGDV